MPEINEDQFQELINEVMEELPEHYVSNMQNVAIVTQDQPTNEQRHKLELRCNETLFGLYEGIPLTKRGAGYSGVLPDKITIFRLPLLSSSSSMIELRENTKRTLWHEIAHHYGLDHDRIHALENGNLKGK